MSQPTAQAATTATRQVFTSRCVLHFIPACSIISCNLLCSWKRRRNLVASRTFFSSLWMSEVPPPGTGLADLVLVVPINRLLSLSRSEWRNALEQIHQMTRAQAHTAMAIIMNMGSNLHHLVKQVGAQPDAGRQQRFVKLGPDAGGRESSHHPAVRVQAALLENEDVLERDHVAFHACHFGEVDHAARAVA